MQQSKAHIQMITRNAFSEYVVGKWKTMLNYQKLL